MATTRGCFGKVFAELSATATAARVMSEVNAWSYEETAEQLDASEIGSCVKKFVAGATETTGTISTWWDTATASEQQHFTVGGTVKLELYPGGNGSGSTYYKTASAVVTSISRSGGVDGIVTNNFGFTVNGALTATSVP